MEGIINMYNYEIEKSIKYIWNFLDVEESKCCFCKTEIGALIRLNQGWCCISCFKDILQGWEGKNGNSKFFKTRN